jgi:hypothetical protein
MNGRFLSGAVTYELLREVVLQQLSSASAGGGASKPSTAAKASYQPNRTAQ